MILLQFFSWIYGLEINSESDLLALADKKDFSFVFKLFIGMNHIFTFIAFPCIFILLFYTNNIKKYLHFRAFNPLLLILLPLALFSLYPLMVLLTQMMDKINLPEFLTGLDENALESMSRLLTMDNITELMINIFLIGIIPGIGEELLFRGIIQKELFSFFKNYHLAIWVTALIFGVFHFQIVGFPSKMIIGLVLGYSYYYSANLLVPMFLHALNNSLATVSFYIFKAQQDIPSSTTDNISVWPAIAATCIFFWLLKNIQSLSLLNADIDEQ